MGLLRNLLTLPISGPVNGTLWVAGKVHEAADKELNDPATLRKSLVALERQLLAGVITEDAYDAAENDILERLQGLQ